MTKRYALFGGPTYYPSGGWEDFVGFFDTAEDAQKTADEPDCEGSNWPKYEWAQIVDQETHKIVLKRDGWGDLSQIEWE